MNLEGNTYSLLETERLLELGEAAEGKEAQEAQMILNHKAAIELLVDQAEEVGFNRQILDTAAAIADPFEQAFFAMVHLPYLQPFEDVNKRVSRLAANLPLIRQNLCPLSFVDVPERAYIDAILGVYELNRIELLRDVFIWAYKRSCARYGTVRRSLGEPDPFRLRYRAPVAATITLIVRDGMDKKTAPAFIRQRAAAGIPQEDQARFVEVVETELMSLHEGNIVRYRLRPSQYQSWRETWR
jgi:Fic/DOC family